MKINIKVVSIELTPALDSYVNDKLNSLDKFFVGRRDDEPMADVEIGKTTQHHKLGDYFRAEIILRYAGQYYRVEATESDLYAAIDVAKDQLAEEIRTKNKKRTSLIKRGGRTIKELLRGIGGRRWR